MRELEELLVREILGKKAYQQFIDGKIANNELAPYIATIHALSSNYISSDKTRVTPLEKLAAESYALYYLPINFRKIIELLGYCDREFLKKVRKVLDFGCGPGTASLALISRLPELNHLTLVDRSKAMLTLADKLIINSRWKDNYVKLEAINDSTFNPKENFDLIVIANALTEVGALNDEKLLFTLTEALNENGYLIILEPALQATTRRMMHLRSRLLEERLEISPVFPCTHRAWCQMLSQSDTDWCHGEINWEEPGLVKQIDILTGFNKHRIKYCGFVFQKSLVSKEGFRVVSIPTKAKWGIEMLVCGENKYGLVKIGKKDRDPLAQKLRKSKLYSLCTDII